MGFGRGPSFCLGTVLIEAAVNRTQSQHTYLSYTAHLCKDLPETREPREGHWLARQRSQVTLNPHCITTVLPRPSLNKITLFALGSLKTLER